MAAVRPGRRQVRILRDETVSVADVGLLFALSLESYSLGISHS